jgi:hypothetical protein
VVSPILAVEDVRLAVVRALLVGGVAALSLAALGGGLGSIPIAVIAGAAVGQSALVEGWARRRGTSPLSAGLIACALCLVVGGLGAWQLPYAQAAVHGDWSQGLGDLGRVPQAIPKSLVLLVLGLVLPLGAVTRARVSAAPPDALIMGFLTFASGALALLVGIVVVVYGLAGSGGASLALAGFGGASLVLSWFGLLAVTLVPTALLLGVWWAADQLADRGREAPPPGDAGGQAPDEPSA